MKSVKKLLLISLFILTGCGSQETKPLISDGKYYTNYELQYYYGNEGETFTIDLEKDIFSDGMILSWNNELTKLKETYDSFELGYYILDEFYKYDYKIENVYKAKVTFPSVNNELYCRLINTKENKCSNDLLIGYVYVKQKEYIELNSFDDLYKCGEKGIIESKTFVLNNDLDFNDFEDVWNPISLYTSTIINPNNYVIRNLDFKDEIMKGKIQSTISLFSQVNTSYFDNLIFENVVFDYDTYSKNNQNSDPSLLAESMNNCIVKNINVSSLTIKANNKTNYIGGLVNASFNTAFINNSINLDVTQTGEVDEINGKSIKIIGGLSCKDYKYSYNDYSNYLQYGNEYILTYKRFPAKYNKITGKIQGIDVVGGLFGTVYKEDLKDYEYNIIDVEISSSTGNVGEINGLLEDY